MSVVTEEWTLPEYYNSTMEPKPNKEMGLYTLELQPQEMTQPTLGSHNG